MKQPQRQSRWRVSKALPVAILLSLALLFFLAWFNRFLGLRSGGGEFGGGMTLLAGKLPYRDYYSAGPPLNQIKSALELGLFGHTLFVSRLFAVIERLLIACVLYAWLRRTFSARAAMLASLVTIIVSAGDRTDPLASYNHDAILFAMLAGLAASLSVEAAKRPMVLAFSAFAGTTAGLSILTKQTVGLGAATCVLTIGAIGIFRLSNFRRAALWICAYCVGLAVPLLCIAAWLQRFGALRACLTMLFVSGPAAKASKPGIFLLREWTVAAGNTVWLSLAVVALALSARAIWRATIDTQNSEADRDWRWTALLALIVIGAAEALALTSLPALQDFSKTSIYYVMIGTPVIALTGLISAWRVHSTNSVRTLQIALFGALSWSVAVTLSLSWPAFEAMTLPGLGLLLAAAIDGTRPGGRRFLYLVMAAMVFIQVREKLDLPFAFDNQDEPPIRFATEKSSQPMLRGMRLPAEEVRLLEDVSAAAQTARAHGLNSGFTYPEMSIVYPLTGLQFPTRAGSHNIDVVTDAFAREEAARLQASPPAVVLYARPTEEQLAAQEVIWRSGHPSGQRDMVQALDRIVASYHLAGTYQLRPEDTPIRLYVQFPEFSK